MIKKIASSSIDKPNEAGKHQNQGIISGPAAELSRKISAEDAKNHKLGTDRLEDAIFGIGKAAIAVRQLPEYRISEHLWNLLEGKAKVSPRASGNITANNIGAQSTVIFEDEPDKQYIVVVVPVRGA